jgi:transcriptional regulator with XRE-family HTH domain
VSDEVRTRICAELDYHGEDWLDVACLHLQARMNQLRRLKLYDVSTIGGRLRCARECAGMRQYELARRVGMDRREISQMELERRPLPAVKVAGLCMSLKIKTTWLILGEGEGPQAGYGILRKDQSPRQAKATTRAKWRAEALDEARRRNAERKSLTTRAVPTHSEPEQNIPSRHRANEEAVEPSQIEHP